MYNEAEYVFDWNEVIRKVILVVIAILIIGLAIFIINRPKKNIDFFKDNLNTMEKIATNYYSQYNSDSTLTLKEMIDKKMILDFVDENGKQCDLNNSYIKKNKNKIEVNLKCNTKEKNITL